MVNFEHFPKYQSANMHSVVRNLLDAIHASNYTAYHHLLTYYIIEKIRIRSVYKTKKDTSLNEKMFRCEILGYLDGISSHESRSTAVAFYVGDENYLHIRRAAYDLGINFESHVMDYAQHMRALLRDNNLCHSSYLTNNFSIFMRPGGSLLNIESDEEFNARKSKL
jgi:hypothetical protein